MTNVRHVSPDTPSLFLRVSGSLTPPANQLGFEKRVGRLESLQIRIRIKPKWPRRLREHLRNVRQPLPFAAEAYFCRMRLTPSVTCFDDSVAPLMFLISSPSCSGEPAPLPTNCPRHEASRTS